MLPTRQSQNATVSGAARACSSRFERMSSTAKVSAEAIPQASATHPKALPSSPASATRAMPIATRHERTERHVRELLGEEERGEHGEEDRRGVEGEHRERDGAALDRLEEEPPVHRLDDAERDERRQVRPGRRRWSRRVASATTASVIAASPSRTNARGAAPTATAPAMTAMRPHEVARPAETEVPPHSGRDGHAPSPTGCGRRPRTAHSGLGHRLTSAPAPRLRRGRDSGRRRSS